MRWFEHRGTDRHSAEIAFAEHALGECGYARFFKLCEVVAERGGTADDFEPELRLTNRATTKLWLAHELGISPRDLDKTLTIFARGKLIDPRLLRRKVIRVPQLLERLDEWTKRRIARKKLRGDSRGSRKAQRRKSRASTESLRNSPQSQHPTVTEQGGSLSSSTGALSNAQRSQAAAESDDDTITPIVKKLGEHFPRASQATLTWAVQQIRARAKTPPRTVAYYEKGVSAVFENLPAERDLFLATQAHTILARDSSSADIAERLKAIAARCDLDYDAGVIDSAIVTAARRLRRERETDAELHAGAGPELPR